MNRRTRFFFIPVDVPLITVATHELAELAVAHRTPTPSRHASHSDAGAGHCCDREPRSALSSAARTPYSQLAASFLCDIGCARAKNIHSQRRRCDSEEAQYPDTQATTFDADENGTLGCARKTVRISQVRCWPCEPEPSPSCVFLVRTHQPYRAPTGFAPSNTRVEQNTMKMFQYRSAPASNRGGLNDSSKHRTRSSFVTRDSWSLTIQGPWGYCLCCPVQWVSARLRGCGMSARRETNVRCR